MAKRANPRHGSMGFWHRVRAKRPIPRIRTWNTNKQGLLGFAGYKAGMTHIVGTDSRKNSITKGEDLAIPVTVIECPPLKLVGFRSYSLKNHTLAPHKDFLFTTQKSDKNLSKARNLPKTKSAGEKELDSASSSKATMMITALISTNPSETGIKKKPEYFELRIGGDVGAQAEFIKQHISKPIHVADVFEEGAYLDARAISRGKGTQGPVKRFGINLKNHKSEKGRRAPGSLGGWKGHGHFMYRIAHAGQTGYQQRVDYNHQILKIESEPFTPKGGFIGYGVTKNPCLLVKGSIPGPKKRLIMLTPAIRQKRNDSIPTVHHVSDKSHQG